MSKLKPNPPQSNRQFTRQWIVSAFRNRAWGIVICNLRFMATRGEHVSVAGSMKVLWRVERSQRISLGAVLKNTVHYTLNLVGDRTYNRNWTTTFKASVNNWSGDVYCFQYCVSAYSKYVFPRSTFKYSVARSIQPQDKLRKPTVAHVHAYQCITYLQENMFLVSALLASRFSTTT